MGQYYGVLMSVRKKWQRYDVRTKTSGFVGYKLTEHSWWLNPVPNAVAEMALKRHVRVAWVGDYSAHCISPNPNLSQETMDLLYDMAWGSHRLTEGQLVGGELTLNGLFVNNHTKGVFLDCSKYYERSLRDGWCVHPLPLLTALGNGRGGGDYRGNDIERVGTWAWDEISVSGEPVNGFKEVECCFFEFE